MAVAEYAKPLDDNWQITFAADYDIDIDDGLGREARHRGASDMLDLLSERSKNLADVIPECGEQRRPPRVIVDDLNCFIHQPAFNPTGCCRPALRLLRIVAQHWCSPTTASGRFTSS